MSSLAGQLAASFGHAAEVLERSAELADLHAEREAAKGLDDRAVIERERASRARDAAKHGRENARRWT